MAYLLSKRLRPKQKCYRRVKRGIVGSFVRYLQNKGIVRNPIVTESIHSKVLSEYETFLREQLNLAEQSIAHAVNHCLKFLHYVDAMGIRNLRDIKPNIIQKFIQSGLKKPSKSLVCLRYWALRKYISYLRSIGEIETAFSNILTAPRIYQRKRCPGFLTREEIQTMLSSIDRRTPIGKRDYAMILLLSTYGLRGGEVVQLKLDDIEWRTDVIHIRGRKARNNSVYPLAASVGEAILSYLKKARPPNQHRQIFLSYNAPHNPISRAALTSVVKKYLQRSGLTANRGSSHTFRYSCAQQLFESDFSIKVIADYLGHRDLRSTRRYMMIDIKHLREVANNSSEDLL